MVAWRRTQQECDCKRAVECCESTYGGMHVAFNNAGIYATAPFVDVGEDMVDSIFATNLKSVVYCLKYQVKNLEPGQRCEQTFF